MSINAGVGPTGDASTLHGNDLIEEVDPKLLFDDHSTTQSSPSGWYPNGIEAADSDMVNESYAPSGSVVPVVGDVTNLPQSEFNPRMPARGSRLIDQLPNSAGRGGTMQ